jgi:hypothetical protein
MAEGMAQSDVILYKCRSLRKVFIKLLAIKSHKNIV